MHDSAVAEHTKKKQEHASCGGGDCSWLLCMVLLGDSHFYTYTSTLHSDCHVFLCMLLWACLFLETSPMPLAIDCCGLLPSSCSLDFIVSKVLTTPRTLRHMAYSLQIAISQDAL